MFDRQAVLLRLANADGQDWTVETMNDRVAELMYGSAADVVHEYMINIDDVMDLIAGSFASGVVHGRSESGLVSNKKDGLHQYAAVKHAYERGNAALRLRDMLLEEGKYRLPFPEEGKRKRR